MATLTTCVIGWEESDKDFVGNEFIRSFIHYSSKKTFTSHNALKLRPGGGGHMR